MRYSTHFIESTENWIVVDSFSYTFTPKLFDTEKSAKIFAKTKENDWINLINSKSPIQVAS